MVSAHEGDPIMRGQLALAGAIAFSVSLAAGHAAPSGSKAVNKPVAVDHPEPMWNLGDLYHSPEAWTAAREKLKTEAQTLDRLKGTFGNSAKDMLAALDKMSHVRRESNRLSVYATLKADEDVRIAANQERQQAASALQTLIGEKEAWVTPEIIAVGAEKVKRFESESPDLARRFGLFLDNALRSAPHTLSLESENVIAATGDVLNQPNNIYSQLSNGELPFPPLTLSDGTKIERLDQAAYSKYRQAPVRADRKKVFDAFWATFHKYEGTFGQTLNTQVLGETFSAKVRRFPNSLAAATFPDNMPEAVYRMLVAQANAGLPSMVRYLKLRKKLLGIKGDLAYYDVYPTMFKPDHPLHFSVADAERIGLDVTAAYGSEYTTLLHKGFGGRWMDVYPRPGKASGAYMNGAAYDVHPYLHLNHNDDYQSLSTFVHEWGHGVHTLLSDKTQPYETSDYSTFIAETASIANEMLLNDYMVAHAKTKNEKLYYLGEGVELIRQTFFRQTMFAEYQLALHEQVEKGNQLTGAKMTEMYCGLLRKYYGEAEGAMKIDPSYCIEWAFIPHFYYGFYVYQYATSMAGAAQFTVAIEHEGAPARERFIAMLKAGGSDYPYRLYKKAGLDMATPEPYQALVKRMNRLMDDIDRLLAEK
jgi:oligoendopeptidase F